MATVPNRPRSRTPSRCPTPALINPSRLATPELRTYSNNSHFYDRSSPPGSMMPTNAVSFPLQAHEQVLESSASSVVESDGMLLQDADGEGSNADEGEGTAVGTIAATAGEEDPKKTLREQLRRTLSRRSSLSDLAMSRSWSKGKGKDKDVDIPELAHSIESPYIPREYFVLTDAGKPVFTTRPDSSEIPSILGVIQALISVFLDDSDRLRCINAGRTRITFLIRSPLYYACVSSWGEPESVTRTHLEYLHLQILSVVSAAQLQRIYERRGNFDLRKLLNGAETFLTSILTTLESDLALSTSSLHVLRVENTLRNRIADSLVPSGIRLKEILYIVLVAQGKVVTIARPKKHSIHPADVHILLNTIHAPPIFSSLAPALWIPICLPRFNPQGFVNAYVQFWGREGDIPTENSSKPESTNQQANQAGITLLCISGGANFEDVRSIGASVIERLESEGTIEALKNAIESSRTLYSTSELGIPGLRHFMYKSRAQVQITFPVWEDPYEDLDERRRLMTLYQILHDAIHGKSGQSETLKMQYIRTEKESVLGWITQQFELYIALSPRLPKSAAVGAANSVVRWVKKDEGSVFLRDAPMF